ncbi:hypothetical protein [Tenacibaculum jejuense]|uniref:Uncharacterized protein n=1 Tax=Tenacibaculum jejuense TaxID=584609 RepID=A0A238UBN3_9FLAO|nr:hypothetical protein [Tenacibaculum jejuense]SNR15894.1 conserved protein of unknown function [Tenacibaculum jejuense]
MNFEKYIIVDGLSKKDLIDFVQKLANLYSDTGFTKEVKIFENRTVPNEFFINFSQNTDFERFKYFVNFLFYPCSTKGDSSHKVYGYWTLSKGDDINKELYGKRIQLYISENDEDGDNVYGIPKNWTESIKLGFACGHEYVPLGKKEFDFFEKKYSKSDFSALQSIYGVMDKTEKEKTGCSFFLVLTILIGIICLI